MAPRVHPAQSKDEAGLRLTARGHRILSRTNVARCADRNAICHPEIKALRNTRAFWAPGVSSSGMIISAMCSIIRYCSGEKKRGLYETDSDLPPGCGWS